MQHGTTDHTAWAWMARRNTEMFSSLHPCTPEKLLWVIGPESQKKLCHFYIWSEIIGSKVFFRMFHHPFSPTPPQKKVEKQFGRFLGWWKFLFSRKPVQLNKDLKPGSILKYQVEPPWLVPRISTKKNRPGRMPKLLDANSCWFSSLICTNSVKPESYK